MKPKVNNLNDALAYQLEGMYYVEKKLQKTLPDCINHATSRALKSQIKKYLDSARDKRVKLKRIFSYLLTGPFDCKNKVIEKLMEEESKILKYTNNSELKDALLIGNLQAINHYKISVYGTAKAFALILELQKVVDLLQEVLDWEKEANQALTKIAIKEVNEKAAALAIA
jgi:ferritin-like metal-binding protein YciE